MMRCLAEIEGVLLEHDGAADDVAGKVAEIPAVPAGKGQWVLQLRTCTAEQRSDAWGEATEAEYMTMERQLEKLFPLVAPRPEVRGIAQPAAAAAESPANEAAAPCVSVTESGAHMFATLVLDV
eukprot:TRINITY_DN10789_c0_g2_i1.p1 TRINITY_DN10789_c0_g2~~TRINITY_DN10789_c0_g2_i1.p1  ORF type:complete len:124 (+),score=24.42 TRINITY_DN10789_c0_g2_i1:251-622(+)